MNTTFRYIISVLACATLFAGVAEAQTPQKVDSKRSPVHVEKNATPNGDGTYTLRLESFVTGYSYTSTTTTKKALDIVLVLDTSYSMRDNSMEKTGWFKGLGTYSMENAYAQSDNLSGKYCLVDGVYYPVSSISRSGSKGKYTYTITYKDGYNSRTVSSSVVSSMSFYDFSAEEKSGYQSGIYTIQRMDALKEACTSFLNSIKAESTSTVTHKVSIIDFNSDANTTRLATLSSDWAALQRIINDLDKQMSSTTFPSKAMDWAKADLDSDTRDSKKIIVMFTDGAPAEASGWDKLKFTTAMNTEANKVIVSSGKSKKVNYDVYTVGTFDEDNTIDDIKNYLKYTSSNYLSATSMTAPGSMSSDKYTHFAKDANALNDIFNAISEDVKSNGGAGEERATVTNHVTVKDIITPSFEIPVDASGEIDKSKIVVKTADVTGITKADGFDKDSYAYVFDGYSWGEESTDASLTVVPTKDETTGKTTVSVEGFDFSKNWVGFDEEYDNSSTPTSSSKRGSKLVIEIYIQQNPDEAGGEVETNDPASGIYYGETSANIELQRYPSTGKFYVPMDMTIVKKGLPVGETALFNIYKGSGESKEFFMRVAITATDPDVTVVTQTVAKLDIQDKSGKAIVYTVEEDTNWTYRYKSIRPDDYSKPLYKIVDGEFVHDAKFVFGTEMNSIGNNLGDQFFDEHNVNNQFNSKVSAKKTSTK